MACLEELKRHLSRMDTPQLTDAAIFAYKAYISGDMKVNFLQQINQAVVKQSPERRTYDAPKLLEVLAMHHTITEECFNAICRDIYRAVDLFEPVDYQRTSRVLVRFTVPLIHVIQRQLKRENMENLKMVNMLSKRTIDHWEEFSEYQYHCVARDLTLAGPPFMSLLTDLWSRNRCVPITIV
ncbi:uncharacterized protein BXIN_2266 [Babesia sp. Xinjiang]|uniref:uncharacterized protein n=1 Tax=Babesia sp. Xinjiang TaxID=462227 RepID=UPI000A21D655|nr:uncharacterized protein BXIN_2266 [Babesia sp. Xinjiang]ORM40807.1 hypothetical protein BXIN_2266 [Babesia sp. Xinjiang]